MSTFEQHANIGDRIDEVLNILSTLVPDSKSHAVYAAQHVFAAQMAMFKARTGIAQDLGYDILRQRREAREKERKK